MPLLSDETNVFVLTIESNRCSANQYLHKGTALELFCKQASLNFNTCTLRMAVWQMGWASSVMQRASNWIWKAWSSLVCYLENKIWEPLPMLVHFCVCVLFCVYIYEKMRALSKKCFKTVIDLCRYTHLCNFLKMFFHIWLFSFIKWWAYE